MQQLTPQGQNIVNDLSQRYGFSQDAVTHMLFAVLNGNGSMAQFNHSEFAGSGQWMRGGMLMLGDMFNHSLKGSVDGLCSEISDILAREPGLMRSGSFQSQSQSGSSHQQQAAGAIGAGESSLFVPDPATNWWPKEFGAPSATGNQNNIRYAYFGNTCRLAVESNGEVWVYDTQDHQIGGFSQQQGAGGSILFTSQYGTVNLSSLPVVTVNGQPIPIPQQAAPSQPNAPSNPVNSAAEADIFDAIERLGTLHTKGILTDEEFAQKKAELLERL
ncbi:MAG: SHOCT domain-containing protein [Pseudomonadota bacterium]